MSQRKPKDQIALSTKIRQKVAPMIGNLNMYLSAVRDSLNVPDDWVMMNDQQGIPAAFVPPKEPEVPTKVVKKKAGKKAGKRG